MPNTTKETLSTVETTLSVVDALRELDGARVTELAEYLGMSKSTIHRHLATLHENDYLIKEGGEYQLGLRFLDVGEYTRYSREEYQKAKPYVEHLAETTGKRCQFVTEEHGRAVYVHVASGNHGEETETRLGKRMYLHSTAVGKSILAHLPDERVREIINRWGLPKQGPHSSSSEAELFEKLERVRDRGYAFNRGGFVDGLRSVGAPVFDPQGRVIGAISVSGPVHHMRGDYYEEELPALILEKIAEFEADLSE